MKRLDNKEHKLNELVALKMKDKVVVKVNISKNERENVKTMSAT